MMTLRYNTVNFFLYVVILLNISNKIVTMFYTFSFCSQILLPSPDPSITWVVSTQADISERSRSFWSHLYYPVQVPLLWREYRPIHHLYRWPALPKQYHGTLFILCTYNVHVNQYCTVIQCTVNEESMCFPTGWWQLGYKLRMYSWKLCLKSFLLIKNTR